MITDERGNIEFAEHGTGPPMLMIPGSFGTGAAWRGVCQAIGGGVRVITTSLQGYGATAERRTAADTSIGNQLDILDRVVDRIGEPVHVAAHSFGGVNALALAMRRPTAVLSLALFEANPVDLLRQEGETALFGDVQSMSMAFCRAYQAGDREAARRVIDFYGGPGTFDGFPDKVRSYVIERTGTNVLDWSTAYGFAAPLDSYRALRMPTLSRAACLIDRGARRTSLHRPARIPR